MLPIARIIKFYKLSTLGYTGLILLLLTLCSCSREQLDSARLKIFLNQGSNLVGVTKDSLFEYYNSYGITLTDNWRNYSLPDSILKESYTCTFNGSEGFKTYDYFIQGNIVKQIKIQEASFWEYLIKGWKNKKSNDELIFVLIFIVFMVWVFITLKNWIKRNKSF